MRKRRVTPIGAAFAALVLLVLLFVMRGALHRPARVVLPQESSSSDASDAALDDSAVGRIAVRPDTVQSAIATLERPARYSRDITIERYYSGGSGVDHVSVSVDGAWMRVDAEKAGGAQSHTISNGERTWVWYGFGMRVRRPSPPMKSRGSRRMRIFCISKSSGSRRRITACLTPWTASL
mgnify:CR=1 FL=1